MNVIDDELFVISESWKWIKKPIRFYDDKNGKEFKESDFLFLMLCEPHHQNKQSFCDDDPFTHCVCVYLCN